MACTHRAILLVTSDVKGTSSSVARQRIHIECELEEDHDGPHRSAEHQEEWKDRGTPVTHIVRHDGD